MPLLWLSLAFVCGILLGDLLGLPWRAWLSLGALALVFEFLRLGVARVFRSRTVPPTDPVVAPAPARRKWVGLVFPALLALALGGALYQASLPEITPAHVAWYNDRETKHILEGVIREPPDMRDEYTNLRVQVDQLHPAGELRFTPVEGLILAKVPPGGGWRYGDRVRLQGYLHTPGEDETFSYRQYLVRQGIYSQFSCGCYECENAQEDCVRLLLHDQGNLVLAWIYDLRGRALTMIYTLFPDPEASLLAGILLGIESGIPANVAQAFRDTGTTHIIAISGFNFAIIAGLFVMLFGRWLGRWRGLIVALLSIALYALFVGGGAAVVRAAIMGGFSVLARQLGRRQHGLNSLAIIAALMALADPHVLWDVGFQLSFAATLGLVLYAEPLGQAFVRFAERRIPTERAQRLAGPVGEYFLYTLAAQLVTLPVILYHFQRLSLISLLANPLILPVQPPIMILGGISVILGMLVQPLGQVAAFLVWPFVAYTIRVVELLAQAPLTTLTIELSLLGAVVFYTILLVWTFAGGRIRDELARRSLSLPPAFASAALIGLALLAIFVWQNALAAPDGRLHLTVFDVGSGDALLVQTPSGRALLIDGGPSPARLSDSLGRRLPLGKRRLDWLVVAGAHDEQIGALPATIERFPPDQVLWAGSLHGTFNARQLQRIFTERQTPVILAERGHVLELGQGARLEVLASSLKGGVLLIEWERLRFLLPIGLDFDSYDALITDHAQPPVTTLLLAESGYAPLNTPEWIARWNPQFLLLSVAAGDDLGRPSPAVLQSLDGYTLLRTDHHGWIQLTTDGVEMWIEVEKIRGDLD